MGNLPGHKELLYPRRIRGRITPIQYICGARPSAIQHTCWIYLLKTLAKNTLKDSLFLLDFTHAKLQGSAERLIVTLSARKWVRVLFWPQRAQVKEIQLRFEYLKSALIENCPIPLTDVYCMLILLPANAHGAGKTRKVSQMGDVNLGAFICSFPFIFFFFFSHVASAFLTLFLLE